MVLKSLAAGLALGLLAGCAGDSVGVETFPELDADDTLEGEVMAPDDLAGGGGGGMDDSTGTAM